MKSYDSTTEMPMQPTTPLAVQAVGAGITLAAATLILLGFVAGLEWETVSKIAAIVFCIPLLLVGANAMVNVIEPLAERITGRDLNMSGAVGDRPDIRLIPVNGSSHTIGGVEPEDWRFFVQTICATQDWTQATWRGASMPSGRRCDNEYWDRLTKPLKAARVIVNAGPRATGELVVTDPNVILEMLGIQ